MTSRRKILNPDTGREVFADGVVGTEVLRRFHPCPPGTVRNAATMECACPPGKYMVAGKCVTVKIKTGDPTWSCRDKIRQPKNTSLCWLVTTMVQMFVSQAMRDLTKARKQSVSQFYDAMKKRYSLPEASQGGLIVQDYLNKTLSYLGVPHLMLHRKTISSTTTTPSVANRFLKEIVVNGDVDLRYDDDASMPYIDAIAPDVIVLTTGDRYERQAWQEYGDANRVNPEQLEGLRPGTHAETVRYNGRTYVLDSLSLFGEFDSKACPYGHYIVGITCDGERFVYDGESDCVLIRAPWPRRPLLKIDHHECKTIPVSSNSKFGMTFDSRSRSCAVYVVVPPPSR